MSNSMTTKKVWRHLFRIRLLNSKRNEKYVFGTSLPARREDKYPWIRESHVSAADNTLEECHVYILK